jgi:hypothetical protein
MHSSLSEPPSLSQEPTDNSQNLSDKNSPSFLDDSTLPISPGQKNQRISSQTGISPPSTAAAMLSDTLLYNSAFLCL